MADRRPTGPTGSPAPLARAVLLVLAALVAVLAGCSDGSGSGAGDPGRGAATTTVAPATTTTARDPLPPSTVAAPDGATATQPDQPSEGFGSSAVAHHDWTVSEGGSGADAWYVFEPASPTPAEAALAIVLHGYYEFEGYDTMAELIRHTVQTGSIVVYPRWQTGITEPCPGPFDVEPCVDSALAGIRGAIEHLTGGGDRVRPDLDRTSYYGFSFGGVLTANLTNRWQELDLPRPRAIFLDDLHDGGLDGPGEPALDDSMAGIPDDVLLECHVGADGVIAEDPSGGCNALFPKLDHIPEANKAIVATVTDRHGEPALGSGHGVCAARPGGADAYDWGFCWKVWDALRAAVDTGTPPTAAIGDDPAHTDNGTWSDGTPIAPLIVQHEAPIRP